MKQQIKTVSLSLLLPALRPAAVLAAEACFRLCNSAFDCPVINGPD